MTLVYISRNMRKGRTRSGISLEGFYEGRKESRLLRFPDRHHDVSYSFGCEFVGVLVRAWLSFISHALCAKIEPGALPALSDFVKVERSQSYWDFWIDIVTHRIRSDVSFLALWRYWTVSSATNFRSREIALEWKCVEISSNSVDVRHWRAA